MRGSRPLTVKKFAEMLDERLRTLSREELEGVLRDMGYDLPPSSRESFLLKLEPTAPATEADLLAQCEEVVECVRQFRAELKERFEDPPPPQNDWYGETEDDPYEDLREDLASLLDDVRCVFEAGRWAIASRAYEEVLAILQLTDEWGRGLSLWSVDRDAETVVRETAARCLRCVYETAKPSDRPRALLAKARELKGIVLGRRENPSLADAEEVFVDDLPERDLFLEEWQALLAGEADDLARALLGEAAVLHRGSDGLADLAQTRGEEDPRLFLELVRALRIEGKEDEAVRAARAALKRLPARLGLRAEIADELAAAARKAGIDDAIAEARWEAFVSDPGLRRLLDLHDIDGARDGRRTWMLRAADRLAERTEESGRRETRQDEERLLRAHALLLAGERDAALALVKTQKPLGWSYASRAQAVVCAVLLEWLCHDSAEEDVPAVKRLVEMYVGEDSPGHAVTEADEPRETSAITLRERALRAHREASEDGEDSWQDDEHLLDGCRRIAVKRANEIARHKYRGAYGRAGAVLAAVAETLRARGNRSAAAGILRRFRKEHGRKYAFIAELKRALGPGWNI